MKKIDVKILHQLLLYLCRKNSPKAKALHREKD